LADRAALNSIDAVLEALRAGRIDADTAKIALNACYFQDLGHTTLDLDRERRTGAGEVIYGEGKTAAQLIDIGRAALHAGRNLLITRVSADKAQAVCDAIPELVHHDDARMLQHLPLPPKMLETHVAVVSAGTSDAPIAAEVSRTCAFFGSRARPINDVGVAGIHRLLARLDELRSARVVVVVAGMEGALPSVVGGLVEAPVIAVPTSVGYGAAFGGIAALLGMLNSCASGVSVVNIDNGFGAGFLASRINRL
jgi:NCAIR mutase (PurE)-related protein